MFININAIKSKKKVPMNKSYLIYDVIKAQTFTKLNLASRSYNKYYKTILLEDAVMLCGIYLPSVVYNFVMTVQ